MGWCCCNKVCSVGNCARILHFSLTLFVFYILLTTPSSELHHVWEHKKPKFFVILSLVVTSTLCYLCASLTDPGYESINHQRDQQSFNNFTTSLNKGHKKDNIATSLGYDSSESDNVMSSDAITGQWTCTSCQIEVQLRSKHCKICQRCVRKFDHHCPWIGNCVGERNHRFFWLFLGLEMVLLGWGIIISWNSLLSSTSLLSWIRVNILTIASLVVVLLGFLASVLLFFFHTYLMVSGQTTWEMASRLKISYLRDLDPPINPFDEGLFKNIFRFFCFVQGINWNSVYYRTVNSIQTTA